MPSRSPHAWIGWVLASQCLVVAVWWFAGWRVGLPLMVASHAVFWWGALHPRAALYSPVLSHLPTREPVVWLTIDDGPSEQTLAVLDLLDGHHARATFFLVGDRAAARPDLAREIVRRGHGIGNHSQSHPAKWFWALGPWRMRREITTAQRQLEDITGVRPPWFRAVIGMANPFVAAPIHDLGLMRVAWSARGFDAVAADTAVVLARVERHLDPGAIILMHEGAPHGNNLEQLAAVLQRLDALGYRTVVPRDPRDLTADALRPAASC